MSARPLSLGTVALLLSSCLSLPAAGQSDFFEEAKGYFLSRTIEGASKHTEALSETPATATIITREDIERYGFRTVADVLNFAVPGYTAATDRTWDFAGGRGLTLFEDYNTRILVMMDGHPLNEPWNNFSGIGREMLVPLDLVERIEVIHGPSSLLYGGYSLFGMVNVVTSNGESLTGARVRVSGGTWDTYEGVASYGISGVIPGASEDDPGTPWNIFAAAGTYRSRGENLDFPLVNVFEPVDLSGGTFWGGPQSGTDFERAPFGFLKAQRGPFSLLARVGYRDHGEVFAENLALYGDPSSVRRDTKNFVELKWRPKIGSYVEGFVRAFADSYKYWGQSPYAADLYYPGREAFFGVVSASTWDVGGEASFTYKRGVHLLTFGVEYRYRQVKDVYVEEDWNSHEVLYQGDETRTSGHLLVAYLQEEWRPVNSLSFVAGATFADTEPGGQTFLPRFAVIFKPRPSLSIKALYGFGFRAPSLYEAANAYVDLSGQVAELPPEEMRSAELSLLWELSSAVSVQAYAFDSRLSGLIRNRAIASGGGGYEALDDAPGRGAGLSVTGRTGPLRGYLNVAYAKAHLERPNTPDQEIPGSSKWLASGGLSFDAGDVTASLLGRYVGRQELDPAFYEEGSAGDFIEANARLLWRTRIALYPLTLSLDIRNIFDSEGTLSASPTQVISYVPIPGRTALLGCEIRF